MDNLQSKLIEIVEDQTVFCNFCLGTEDIQFTNADIKNKIIETFGSQIAEYPLSNYVCTDCKQIIHQAYNFTMRVKKTKKLLASYLNSLDSKIMTISTNLIKSEHNFSKVIINLDEQAVEDCNMLLLKEENLVIKTDSITESSDSDCKPNISDLLQSKECLTALKAVCQFCFKIVDKPTLPTHLKTEHLNEVLNVKCNECIKTPCCHTKYFEHIQMLRKNGDFKIICFDCQRIFKHKHQLISHINVTHLNLLPISCELCNERFLSDENQQCDQSVKKECQLCDSNFKIKEDLTDHELSCSMNKSKIHHEKCPVSFDTLDQLTIQIEVNNHHIEYNSNQNNKSCIGIKERASKVKTKKKKGKHKTRICYLCTDQFDNLKALVHHLKADHRPDEVYKCTLCHKVYATRNNFLSHIKSYSHLRRADPNFKPSFQCNDCETSYNTMLLLERHRNARHLKILPFTCEKCGKAFAAKSNLKLHLTRHLQQKNYQCNFCSDFFTEPTGLKSHILRHHAPEKKKCACEQCGKTFISMSECKMHQLRQHSDKNYNCPLCNGKYATNQNLRGHIKKVHLKNLSLIEYMKESSFAKDLQEVFRDRRAPCIIETCIN